MATERFTHSQVDVSLDIPGGRLEFERTYRSLEYKPRNIGWITPWHALGPNWRHNFEMDFKVVSTQDAANGNTAIYVSDGSGRVDRFDQRLANTLYPATCPPSWRYHYVCPGRDEVLELTYVNITCPCPDSRGVNPTPQWADWEHLDQIDAGPGVVPPFGWYGGCEVPTPMLMGIRVINPDRSETLYVNRTDNGDIINGWRPSWSRTSEGVLITYQLDACQRVSVIAAESGQWIRLNYASDSPPPPQLPSQCSDRLASIEDSAGRRVEYAYWEPGEEGGNPGDLKSATLLGSPGDSARQWRYAYRPRANNIDFPHDSMMTSVTDPRGNVMVVNSYNGNHDQISKQVRYGSTRYDYTYALGQGSVDEDGYASVSVNRDGQVRVLAFVDKDSAKGPRMRSMTEYAGRIPPSLRDGCLDPGCVENPTRASPSGDPLPPRITTYTYTDEDDPYEYGDDDEMRIRSIVYPDGSREVRRYNFDRAVPGGNPYPSGFPTSGLLRRFWIGLLWKVERTSPANGPIQPPVTTTETYDYDYASGVGIGFCSCSGAQPSALTDANGQTTRFEYEGHAVTKVTYPTVAAPGSGDVTPVEEFVRGGGRLYKHLFPAVRGVRREDWYLHGWVHPASDPSLTYESVHPTEVRLGVYGAQATSVQRFEYDDAGNMTRAIDSNNNDTIYKYNGFRELTEVQSRPGPGGQRIRTWFVYDQMGNLIRSDSENRDQNGVLSTTNPAFTTIREYDAMNRLRLVAVEAAETAVPMNVTVLAGVPEPAKFAVTEYKYNAEDMLTEVRSPAVTSGLDPDAVVRMSYDEWNQLYRTTVGNGPMASVTQYDYDGAGNLTQVIEGAGGAAGTPRVTQFVNDGLGRVLKIIRPNGTTIEQTYDPVGNLRASVVKGQIDTGSGANIVLAQGEFTYDAMHRPEFADWRLFDPAQGISAATPIVRTAYSFNPDSTLDSVVEPGNQVTAFDYDRLRRLSKVTDALGNTAEQWYDLNGNLGTQLTRQINALDPTNAQAVRTTRVEFLHDTLDRIFQVRRYIGTADTNDTRLAYDSRGNLVESFDPRSKRTTFVYDPLSRLTQTRRRMDDNVTDVVTNQIWDIASRLVAQSDDNGNTTRYAYDSHSRLVAVRHADGMIQQVGEGMVWPEGSAVPTSFGTPGYDTLDNPLLTTVGRLGGRIRIANTPDIMGWITARDITYLDEASRPASERITYDGIGRLRRAWTRDDGLNSRSMIARRYDSLGRVITESTDFNPPNFPNFNAAVPGTVSYAYTDAGRTAQVQYPGGRVVQWVRDQLERVYQINDIVPAPRGGSTARMLAQFSYAGPSRLVRQINGNGTVSRWSYNGLLGPDFTTLAANDPDAPAPGDTGFGRVSRVSHSAVPTPNIPNPGPFDHWTLVWDRSNNKVGRNQLGTLAAGGAFAPANASYAYDAIDRLISAAVDIPSAGGSKDARFRSLETYALDGVHNRLATTGGASPGPYARGSAGSSTQQLNQYTSSPLSQYTHDQRGNMRSESAHCRGDIAPLQPDGDIGDHQVNVSDLTRFLGQFGQPVVQGPPPPVGSGNAECDINGDGLINIGDLTALLGNFGAGCDWTQYRYDWADRLVEVRASSWTNGQGSGTPPGPARVEVHSYQYDALGRRIAKTLFANGSVGAGLPPARCTRFIHGGVGSAEDAAVGWQVLEEQDGTGRTLATFVPSGRYVDETVCFQRDLAGSGLLENQAVSSSPEPVCGPPVSAAAVVLQEFWLHADDQFSTTSVTDSNGAVVERYDYHDYGFPLILDPDGVPSGANSQGMYASKVGNPRLFTGREWDAESKLYHYRTRAYHPGLGRFLQIDRIGVWGDMASLGNAYGGTAANPLKWFDPLGFAATCKSDYEYHHLLPQEFRDRFKDIFDIDIDNEEWGLLMPYKDHRALHSSKWNDKWREFLDLYAGKNAKGKTAAVRRFLAGLFADKTFAQHLVSGVKSAQNYGAWSGMLGPAKNAAYANQRTLQAAEFSAFVSAAESGSATKAVLGSMAKKIGLIFIAVATLADVANGENVVKALFDNAVFDSDTLREAAEAAQEYVSNSVDQATDNSHRSIRDQQGRGQTDDEVLRIIHDLHPGNRTPTQ
jgi:RHS repeat-associated protein